MSILRAGLILSCLSVIACSSVTPDPAGGPGPDGGSAADAGANNTGQVCQSGNDLIYVVDQQYRLLSFDPQKVGSGDPFSLVGSLDCPASAPWPDWPGDSVATPFSMSVDRNGMAWVLYTSGEIFNVSINDARCISTGFQKGSGGFELFGMGYVSDAAGSNEETLFLAGGSTDDVVSGGQLGMLSTNLSASSLGNLPTGENNPELTGTGEGELYAYYPGTFENFIARLNKVNSSIEQEWQLDPLGGLVSAWAFAHWGGKFYVFVTTEGFGTTSQVRVFDPATGQETVAVSSSPYVVVGAGVSTCAPIVVE